MSDEKLGFCPLFKEICYGKDCQWWMIHREVTSDGVQTEGLCAVVKMARGVEISIDVED